jgi:hypothetical protein
MVSVVGWDYGGYTPPFDIFSERKDSKKDASEESRGYNSIIIIV